MTEANCTHMYDVDVCAGGDDVTLFQITFFPYVLPPMEKRITFFVLVNVCGLALI